MAKKKTSPPPPKPLPERDPTELLEETDSDHLLEEGLPHPRGTLTIMLLYLAVIIGFWGYIYSLLFYAEGESS